MQDHDQTTPPEEPQEGSPEQEPSPPDPETLAGRVHEALRGCYDPEIPVNIVEIGLIYGVDATPDGTVVIRMTLTSPNCPAAQTLPIDAQNAALTVQGVKNAQVELVWDPPWNPSMMSEAAKLQLNLPYF